MAKPISKVRREWIRRVIAALTPFVQQSECVSRRAALKLVEPSSDWERRELDRIRRHGNAVVRGDETDPLWYSNFGVALQTPMLKDTGIADALQTEIPVKADQLIRHIPKLIVRGAIGSVNEIYTKRVVNGTLRETRPIPGETYILKAGRVMLFVVEDGYVLTQPVPNSNRHEGELFNHEGTYLGIATVIIGENVNKPTEEDYIRHTPVKLNFMTEADALKLSNPTIGDSYINRVDHVITWDGYEWADCGKFNKDLGLARTEDGGARPKSDYELVEDYFGYPLKIKGSHCGDINRIPMTGNEKGDVWMLGDPVSLSGIQLSEAFWDRVFWDGSAWRDIHYPYDYNYRLLGNVVSPDYIPVMMYLGAPVTVLNTAVALNQLPANPEKGTVAQVFIIKDVTTVPNYYLNRNNLLEVFWDGGEWLTTVQPFIPLHKVYKYVNPEDKKAAEPESPAPKKVGWFKRLFSSARD